jgi:hypothetical protein
MTACKGCAHPQRVQIDADLVANVPFRKIIAYSGMSLGSISRHREHLKTELAHAYKARESANAEHAGNLINRIDNVISEAQDILSHAKAKGDIKAAISALGAITRALELVGRSSGEIPNGGGLHLHRTTITNHNLNVDVGSDLELALAVAEATRGFDAGEIDRLRLLAASASG